MQPANEFRSHDFNRINFALYAGADSGLWLNWFMKTPSGVNWEMPQNLLDQASGELNHLKIYTAEIKSSHPNAGYRCVGLTPGNTSFGVGGLSAYFNRSLAGLVLKTWDPPPIRPTAARKCWLTIYRAQPVMSLTWSIDCNFHGKWSSSHSWHRWIVLSCDTSLTVSSLPYRLQ